MQRMTDNEALIARIVLSFAGEFPLAGTVVDQVDDLADRLRKYDLQFVRPGMMECPKCGGTNTAWEPYHQDVRCFTCSAKVAE